MASPPPSETFSFASPISSQTYYEEDHALDFDYESWIQQSKIAATTAESSSSSEAHHRREMMMQQPAVDNNMPEEDYELSLRDLTELPSSSSSLPSRARAAATARTPPCPASNTKPSPSSSLQGAAGFIINLFMPSPPTGGKTTVSVVPKKSASADHGRSMQNYTRRRSNGMPGKSYHDSTERKLVSCYPLFSSRRYKAKRAVSGHSCL